MIIDIIIESQN